MFPRVVGVGNIESRSTMNVADKTQETSLNLITPTDRKVDKIIDQASHSGFLRGLKTHLGPPPCTPHNGTQARMGGSDGLKMQAVIRSTDAKSGLLARWADVFARWHK